MSHEQEQALAHDIDLCDLGIALTRGTLRQRYIRHRNSCFAAIKAMNEAAGLSALSDDELLRELIP